MEASDLRLNELLEASLALALYREITALKDWSTFLVGDGRRYEASQGVASQYSEEQRQRLFQLAYQELKAERPAYLYGGFAVDETHSTFAKFVNLIHSADLAAQLARKLEIRNLRIGRLHCVCMGPEHFVSFHLFPFFETQREDCCGFFAYHLTPEWRPEWGGMFQFRGREAHELRSLFPCFNSLDVFRCPQGYWVSPISSHAPGSTFAIFGALYSTE